MKLTRTFKTDNYSTTYIWSAIVEGEELCYQISVDEYSNNRPPIKYLEVKAREAIMKTIENRLFGDMNE